MSLYQIENVFKVNFQFYVIFVLGLSIKQRKTCEANLGPIFGTYTSLTISVPCLRLIRIHSIRHTLRRLWRKVLPTAIRRSPPSAFFSAIYITRKKYARSSNATFSSRITFTRCVKALTKSNSVAPFDLALKSFKTCGKMPSKPAQESLGKDMRA